MSRASNCAFSTADEVISFVRQRKMAITMSRDLVSTPNSMEVPSHKKPQFRLPARDSWEFNAVSLHGETNVSAKTTHHRKSPSPTTNVYTSSSSSRYGKMTEAQQPPCLFCQAAHIVPPLYKFTNISSNERLAFVNSLKCCRNFLRSGHSASICRSKWCCRFCKGRRDVFIL